MRFLSRDDYDVEIKKLNSRLEDLEKEIDSLKSEISNTTIEKNLYNSSSTISEEDVYTEWDMDYGQQKFT
tara:strand:+ start:311 stop:520 length:210 start_codon:yes stop_codon:yes gene_type:complete